MKLRLVHKIAIFMLIIELLFGGILVFYLKSELSNVQKMREKFLRVKYEKQFERDKYLVETLEMDNFHLLISSLKGPISEMLFLLDEKGMRKTIKGILENPLILGVEVFDSDLNQIFMAAYKKDKNIIFDKQIKLIYANVLEQPLEISNEPIGRLRIFYTLDPIEAKIERIYEFQKKELNEHLKMLKKKNKEIFFIALAILAGYIVLTMLAGYAVFYFLVVWRLEKVEEGLEEFFEFLKDPNKKVSKIEKVKIGPEDEICAMIDSLNSNIEEVKTVHNRIYYFMQIVDEYVIYVELDENLRIINASEAFCLLLGVNKGDVLEREFSEFIENKNLSKLFEEIKQNSLAHVEMKLINNIYLDTFITYKKGYFTILAHNITERRLLVRLNSELERKVEEKTKALKDSHKTLQEMFDLVQSSIRYASIIQHSLLPKDSQIRECFEEYFVIYNPKDIVGGDIYLFYNLDKYRCFVVIVDGVGHGVPGAFSSMFAKSVGSHLFSMLKGSDLSVGDILLKSNEYINDLIDSKEIGFDMGVAYIDKKEKILRYAGAKEDLFLVSNGKVEILKGSRFSIGFKTEIDKKVKEYEIKYDENTLIYMTTDGFLDQDGGEKGYPFGKKRFMKLLEEIWDKDLQTQKAILFKEWYKYKGNNEQLDDITVIGIKL